MRVAKFAAPVFALWLAGCPLFDFGKDDDEIDGTSNEAAANALTNAASFTGGELVAGLMPETSLPNVTLAGEDASASPGSITLLPFDAVNPDQDGDPIVATLIQFSGSEEYFEVLVEEPEVDGENVSFELELKLASDVCSELCDKVFAIDVEHAVKTESGGVGEHGNLSLSLDCTKKGNPDRCGGGGGSGGSNVDGSSSSDGRGSDEPAMGGTSTLPDGGIAGGFAGGASIGGSFAALELIRSIQAELDGKCATDEFNDLSPEFEACVQSVVARYPNELASYEPCVNKYYEEQLKCVNEAADCEAALTCDFAAQESSGARHLATCGPAPGPVQAELDRCEALSGGGSVGGNAGTGANPGGVDAGVAITPGGCEPVECDRSADGNICHCKSSCTTTLGGTPMTVPMSMDCVEGTCTCMAGPLLQNSFAVDTCSLEPEVNEWAKCMFPDVP